MDVDPAVTAECVVQELEAVASLKIRVRIWYSVQVKIRLRALARSVLWLDFAKFSLFKVAAPTGRVMQRHPPGQGRFAPRNTT